MIARLPLVVFFGTYLFSCYIGALALLFSVRFRTLFLIFSGSQPIDLSWRDLVTVLTLLHAGPLALWIGYEAVCRLLKGEHEWPGIDGRPMRLAAGVVFLASVAVAVWSLGRVGGVENALQSWLDYNAYVRERWRWFASLDFAEFVNLYTLLPLGATAVMLAMRRWTIAISAIVVVLALQYPLSIRKVLLTSLIMMVFGATIYWGAGRSPRSPYSARRRWALAASIPVGLYAVYVSLTLLTTLGARSQAFQSLLPATVASLEAQEVRDQDRRRLRSARGADALALEFGVTDQAVDRIVESRTSSLVLYTLLAPLTRTSICAIVYPVVFPRWQSYYTPDIGLDILGFGTMPDDNLVVYRYLWPEHDQGSVAAPFHVVLYSQGGLLSAFVGALIVGAFLALAWRLVPVQSGPGVTASLWGALVLTLAVFLAIDSLRNSLVVSYGLAWGGLLILALEVMTRTFRSRSTPAAVA